MATIITPVFRPVQAFGKDVANFLKAAQYWYKSDKVLYTDTSPVTIFRIPAGCIVVACACEINPLWAGTSPVLSLGVSGTTGRHLVTTDITTTTAGFYVKATPGPAFYDYATGADLIVTIGGSSLTAGGAFFWIAVRFYDILQQP